jgi:aminoglycoside N3'-acetyltransferase
MDVAIHSRLLSFGQIDGGVATVFQLIEEMVGPAGTVVVPTYTLADGTIYDPRTTPSQRVGALPEYMLALPERVRSACSMHNHAAIGARAAILELSDGSVSFGPGSDFDHLLAADFQLLLLGTSLTEGATFIHHMEAVAGVPYRQWMGLQRRCVDEDGVQVSRTCQYFGRPPGVRIDENFDVLEPELLAEGTMRRVDTHFGASRMVSLRDLFDCGMAALRRDPLALVRVS